MNAATEFVEGIETSVPVLEPTLGAAMVDLARWHEATGLYAYDPGLACTAACRSAITYVDGQQGVLLYRGYPIDALCEHASFTSVAWLLLNGELPDARELVTFEAKLAADAMPSEAVQAVIRAYPRATHPMAMMIGAVASMSVLDDAGNVDAAAGEAVLDATARANATTRLIGVMPAIAAYAHRHASGAVSARPGAARPIESRGYVTDFLAALATPATGPRDRAADVIAERALRAVMIAQADHEQNASTTTMRLVGSTRANAYACVAASIAALWGPLHGGANEAVLRMLHEIGTVERIGAVIARAKDRSDPFRLMGFGHRVYKHYDPRAKVLRALCHELLYALGLAEDPLFEVALALEAIAADDDYFVSRRLYPNVDFYTGLILRALGIPMSMFTPLFVVSRTVGWLAHWNEQMADPKQRIHRPRQLYTGPVRREWLAAEQR